MLLNPISENVQNINIHEISEVNRQLSVELIKQAKLKTNNQNELMVLLYFDQVLSSYHRFLIKAAIKSKIIPKININQVIIKRLFSNIKNDDQISINVTNNGLNQLTLIEIGHFLIQLIWNSLTYFNLQINESPGMKTNVSKQLYEDIAVHCIKATRNLFTMNKKLEHLTQYQVTYTRLADASIKFVPIANLKNIIWTCLFQKALKEK